MKLVTRARPTGSQRGLKSAKVLFSNLPPLRVLRELRGENIELRATPARKKLALQRVTRYVIPL